MSGESFMYIRVACTTLGLCQLYVEMEGRKGLLLEIMMCVYF